MLSSNFKTHIVTPLWEPSKVLNVPRGLYKNCRPLSPPIAITVTSFPTTVSLSSFAPAAVALFCLPATQTPHQGLWTCSSFKLKFSSLNSVRFLIKLPNSTFSERPFLTTLCTKIRPDYITVFPLTLFFFLPEQWSSHDIFTFSMLSLPNLECQPFEFYCSLLHP